MREGWEYKKLGDCFPYIKNGANIKQIKGADGLPITRIETLSGGVFNRDRMGYAGIYNLDKYSDYVLEDGDLLLSHINSKTYIGRTVEYRAKNGETIIHGMNLLRLKSNSDVINSSFFAYYTLSNEFNTNVAKVRKDAVNQSSIAISDIRKFSIPVPPIQSQQYVVDELDKINELIRLKKEQLKDYDNLAQSIFYEMFGDPVVNEKGWEVKKLGEVALIKTGPFGSMLHKEDYITGGIPLINPMHIQNFKAVPDKDFSISKEKAAELCNYQLKINDVIFARRGDIGRCAVISDKEAGCLCGTGSLFVRFERKLSSIYTMYVVRTTSFIKELVSKAKGATMLNLNSSTMENLRFPIPPLPLQQLFAQRIELIEQQKDEIKSTIADLKTLLASRMQYWFD